MKRVRARCGLVKLKRLESKCPPLALPGSFVPSAPDGRLDLRRNGKTGQSFWGCSCYPACDYTEAHEGPPSLEKIIPPRSEWRGHFKAPAEIVKKDSSMLVNLFLPFGITFLGGPSGHGKTWLAISLAKSLFHGAKFLEYFPVTQQAPIIYLVPESGESAFKRRLESMGLGEVKDGFLCQTLADGPPIKLDSPYLLAAVKDLRPVVFLDTAVRFNPSDDENDGTQNAQGLARLIFELLGHGAQAVVPLHHSPKSLTGPGAGEPTLETTLRGTGDLGAMADAVYCVRSIDVKNFRATVYCVKARDFEPSEEFEIQGRPFIDTTRDIKLIRAPHMSLEEGEASDISILEAALALSPSASLRSLEKTCHISKSKIGRLLAKAHWVSEKDGRWVKQKSL